MSQILNYKFYLNFKNVDSFGRIEITEPEGFDGASFVVEQETKRYGRDAYKINEEISLTFKKGEFDSVDYPSQYPNGTMIYNLTMGYEYLEEVYKKHGFEANVDFEIELNGETFIPSNLDFQTSESDGYSYISMKALQESDKQLLKRRSDIVTDIFSTEDLDGNEVTPAQTENLLLRAKPIDQYSNWLTPESYTDVLLNFGTSDFFYAFNFCNQSINYGIDDSLSFIQGFKQIYNSSDYELISDFNYLRAENVLTNGGINISGINISLSNDNVLSEYTGLNFCKFRIYYLIGETFDYSEKQELFSIELGTETEYNYTGDFTITEDLLIDYKFWFWFEFDTPPASSTFNRTAYTVTFNESMTVDARYTSTAVDTVIKAVRYIDVFKENTKRVNGFDFDSKILDVGGKYYDQFAFTGNLIKQRDDVAFPVKFEDRVADLFELNCDYQTINGKVYSSQYKDFYPNKEIGVFVSSPDATFKRTFNERYAINEFEFGYKNYEQDRDEENTVDAIHTENQRLLSNKQVENTKSIDIDLIRDAYKIEATRKLEVKETTSTSDDDKIFVVDVVPLSPISRGGFSALMTHNVNDEDKVQLLKSLDLPSWAVLGFGLGDIFNIDSEDNEGEYTVYDIQDAVITLTPVSPLTQSFTGESYTKVSYPFTNVVYTNRTNEGLVYAENLLNADNFSNLKYSIRRNIKTWETYLATASKFNPSGNIKSTYFKDNGSCITRFDNETENVQEDETILNSDLPTPILEPYIYETRLLAPFSDMKSVMDAIDTINEDNTIGGFIRCIDNNERVLRLYPQKLEYIPSTETLTLTGELKYDGEGVTIVTNSGTITINEVGYDKEDVWYIFDGDYLKIYDSNHLPIITPTKYDEITVDDNTFESAVLLSEYLYNV